MAMQSAGLWYFDEEGKIFLKDNPAIREMMPILKEIDQKELAKPVDYFAPEGIGAVTSGEVAAVNSAIWFSATIRSAEDQKGKWAYTHLPQLERQLMGRPLFKPRRIKLVSFERFAK